jgi:hypothetical protein
MTIALEASVEVIKVLWNIGPPDGGMRVVTAFGGQMLQLPVTRGLDPSSSKSVQTSSLTVTVPCTPPQSGQRFFAEALRHGCENLAQLSPPS